MAWMKKRACFSDLIHRMHRCVPLLTSISNHFKFQIYILNQKSISLLSLPTQRGVLLWLLHVPSGWQAAVVSSLDESLYPSLQK